MDSTDAVMKAIDAQVREQRLAAQQAAGQLTLGELIALLKGCSEEKPVVFPAESGPLDSPVETYPGEFFSYRGYYEDIAIEQAQPSSPRYASGAVVIEHPTVEAFRSRLEGTIGQVFEGYKGGEFTMGRWTPVWVENDYSRATGYGIIGVRETEERVELITAKVD
jgi:hypothetical protein